MEMLIIVHTCWLNTYSWVSQCSTGIWDGKFNVTFSKGQQLELNSACHMCWVSRSKATQLVKSCCVHSSIGVCKYVGLVFVLECSTKVTKQLSPIWKRLKIVAPQQVDCVILITYFVRSKTVKIIGMKKMVWYVVILYRDHMISHLRLAFYICVCQMDLYLHI